jgi:predicted nucleotidyltransferase component of viral defense system
VIPQAYITQWSGGAPWPNELQIEQDLVLSRLIVDIANHELLGRELAFRGGTCLHKLHLPTALRYSEDLDYVRTTDGPIGEIIDALRAVTNGVGLEEHSRKLNQGIVTYVCQAPAERDAGTLRIKIEINIDETEAFLPREQLPYQVLSPWFEGTCDVSTFALDELMATKLRALYQRRKGRDLFDLWHVLVALGTNDPRIVAGLTHYMGEHVFTYPQLSQNLKAKLENPDFSQDLEALVTQTPEAYSSTVAADLVMERLGAWLHNAPAADQIANRAWHGSVRLTVEVAWWV